MDASDLIIPRWPVQFRLGEALLRQVDHAAAVEGVSRNQWLVSAIQGLLELGKPMPYKFTARKLLKDKVTTMVRVDGLTLELMDEACDEENMVRTVFLLDAGLTKLRMNGGQRR